MGLRRGGAGQTKKVLHHFSRWQLTLLLIIASFVVTGTALLFWPKSAQAPESRRTSQTKVIKPAPKAQPNTVRLIATGDTIAHDALNQAALQPDGSYDYYQFMKPMQPYFDKAQVRFCNQAVPGAGQQFGIRGYPVFNSPLEVAHGLVKLGCNVVNTGTNHTFDMGQQVINAMLDDWAKQPNMLAIAGANKSPTEQQTIRYFTVRGVKFAFLSYSTYSNITPPNSYGLTMYDAATAQAQITAARSQADIILVSMRWGTEYSPAIDAKQTAVSQQLADYGADIVIGHGPHVLQPVKQLQGASGRKTLVWYSIGNFLQAQLPIEALVSGIAVMDIDVKTKTVQPPAYLPIYMHYEWTADEKARQDLLKRKNFTLVPLDTAESLLAKSQNNTTVDAQTSRVTNLLNSQSPVKMLTSKTY